MLNLRIGRLDRLFAKCRKRQEAAGQSKDEDSAARAALPIVSLSISGLNYTRLWPSPRVVAESQLHRPTKGADHGRRQHPVSTHAGAVL